MLKDHACMNSWPYALHEKQWSAVIPDARLAHASMPLRAVISGSWACVLLCDHSTLSHLASVIEFMLHSVASQGTRLIQAVVTTQRRDEPAIGL
jgi:hypothetical protein